MKVTKQTLQHLRKKVPLTNTIHYSTFIYNQLKKLNLCKSFSNRVIGHLMSILISIFISGYHGKTTDFSQNSSCPRTTIAHFLNSGKWDDTLLENIRASRPDATREEVMRAAEAAQCQDIIERLPNGLDTIVGSGGTYLSGGENQRIALARAILKDAPIIILDEATAFADAENEHQIQLAFEGLTSGKTVLMIAHRLSTIQDADMILVFGDGKIIERGNHDELLKQNGVYASMWKEYQTQIIWKVGTTVRKEENHD